MRTCRSRRRDDARLMGDRALHDRQQDPQRGGSPRGWFWRFLCVGRVDARQVRAAGLAPYGADLRRQGSGAHRRAAVSSRGFCRVLRSIGLDRRVYEARAVALRGVLVDRGEFRVCAGYLGRGATPVGDLPRWGSPPAARRPRDRRAGQRRQRARQREQLPPPSPAAAAIAELEALACWSTPPQRRPRARPTASRVAGLRHRPPQAVD